MNVLYLNICAHQIRIEFNDLLGILGLIANRGKIAVIVVNGRILTLIIYNILKPKLTFLT